MYFFKKKNKSIFTIDSVNTSAITVAVPFVKRSNSQRVKLKSDLKKHSYVQRAPQCNVRLKVFLLRIQCSLVWSLSHFSGWVAWSLGVWVATGRFQLGMILKESWGSQKWQNWVELQVMLQSNKIERRKLLKHEKVLITVAYNYQEDDDLKFIQGGGRR